MIDVMVRDESWEGIFFLTEGKEAIPAAHHCWHLSRVAGRQLLHRCITLIWFINVC